MPSLSELRDHLSNGTRPLGCPGARTDSYVDLQREWSSRASSADPATRFVDSVYRIALKSEEDALDFIYREMDAWLRASSLDLCNRVLRSLDVGRLPTVHALAFVSITYAARDRLGGRAAFVARVRGLLNVRKPSKVEALLAGIE